MATVKEKTELESRLVTKIVTYSLILETASDDEAKVMAQNTEPELWEKTNENLVVESLPF